MATEGIVVAADAQVGLQFLFAESLETACRGGRLASPQQVLYGAFQAHRALFFLRRGKGAVRAAAAGRSPGLEGARGVRPRFPLSASGLGAAGRRPQRSKLV